MGERVCAEHVSQQKYPMIRLILFVMVMMTLLNGSVCGQTAVAEGEASGVWDRDGSPYLVEGNLTVPDGKVLTIESGVVIEFQGHYSIQVQGCLNAIGTESDSILFTVHDTTGFSDPDTLLGGWNGIRFIDTPVTNDTSKLIHCCLEYSKAVGPVWYLNAGGAISMLQFGKVMISDCLIRNNSAGGRTEHPPMGGGLYLFSADPVIRKTVFLNNRARFGGAVYMDDSDPVFEENIFAGNVAEEGGAISLGGSSHPTFAHDRFSGNEAVNFGGGLLFREPSTVYCQDVNFLRNRSDWGGGVGIMGGTLFAEGCIFSENYAVRWGGGVAGDFATMELQNCTFLRDSSTWGSGGLHMDHTEAEILQCVFEDNRASFGGGFHSLFSHVAVQQSTFRNNQAQSAGAAHLESSDCIVERCLFQENRALGGPGGAVEYIVDTTLITNPWICRWEGCEFTDNSAFHHSGAMRIHQSAEGPSMAEVRVDSCLFYRNHADVYGSFRINGFLKNYLVSRCIFQNNTANRYVAGAAFIGNSSGRVENCLFHANYTNYSDTAKTAHGASLGSGAEATFVNCTISDTSSAKGTGLSVRVGSQATVINSVIWGCGNRPISVATAAEQGSVVQVHYSCIEHGLDSIGVSDSLSALIWGEGNIAELPQFADPGHGDLRLSDSSPCIGSGISELLLDGTLLVVPETDLEGRQRPSPPGSVPDMGAFEQVRGFPVGLSHGAAMESQGCVLYPNVPNPFSLSTQIRVVLRDPCQVNLRVYNLYGECVAVLVSEFKPAGAFNVEWGEGKYPAGYYVCILETDRGDFQTLRLLKLK